MCNYLVSQMFLQFCLKMLLKFLGSVCQQRGAHLRRKGAEEPAEPVAIRHPAPRVGHRDCMRGRTACSDFLSAYGGVGGEPHQLQLVGPSTRLADGL